MFRTTQAEVVAESAPAVVPPESAPSLKFGDYEFNKVIKFGCGHAGRHHFYGAL